MTASVKDVVQQIAGAVPDDASFEDVEEFLYERASVEVGRQEVEAGKTERVPISPGPHATESSVVWSRSAAGELCAAGADGGPDLQTAVAEALKHLIVDPHQGVSLPEMGDLSILEVLVKDPACQGPWWRLVYEIGREGVQVLWFTNNVSCYRNVRRGKRLA